METNVLHKSPEDVYRGVKQAIVEYLESQGLRVERSDKRELFNLDKMISFTQLRNGVIRNQCEHIHNTKKSLPQPQIDMELAEKYGISYKTILRIRWRER